MRGLHVPGAPDAWPLTKERASDEYAGRPARPIERRRPAGVAGGRPLKVYLALAVALTTLYMAVPPFRGAAWLINLIGLLSIVGLMFGIRRNRPARPLPWVMFAIGQTLYWLGDLYTYSYPRYILHHEVPFPSVGDALYLSVYPALMIGMAIIVKRRSPRGNRNTLIDAAIVTLGLSLLSWILLITPYLHDDTLGLLPKLVSVAYPLGDILVLAALVRLLLDGGRRPASFYLLGAGAVALLVTDFVYGVMTLDESFHHQLLLDLGWISYLVLWGAAALHPSMTTLQDPVRGSEAKLTHPRLALLTAASLIAPVCILLKETRRGDMDLIVVVAASIVLFCLVVMRMADLVRQQERSVARERLLGSLGTRLVSCTDAEEMKLAALAALGTLLGDSARATLWHVEEGCQVTVYDPAVSGTRALQAPEQLGERVLVRALHEQDDHNVDPELNVALSLSGGWAHQIALPLAAAPNCREALVVIAAAALPQDSSSAVGAIATQLTLALESARLSDQVHMQRSEARLASLVQHSSDLITVVGPDTAILYQSPSSERVLGYTPEELVGKRFDSLLAGRISEPLLRVLADGSTYARREGEVIECVLRHRDGSDRQFEITHTNLLDDEHVGGIVLNARDISERKAFEEQLAHQAFHDPVTSLPNRALFVERVRHAIGRARREGHMLGVMFLDIDDFKTINDSLGHEAGDDTLIDIARRLAESVRSSDTAARFGGDEFVVLLEDLDGTNTAVEVAERILEDLREPLLVAGKELTLRGSIGISILESGSTAGADELIRDADAAMYIAKRDGKGGFRLFEPDMHTGVLARLELRADLQRALEEGQFEVHYQPIVRLADRRVAGFEALLRWQHPRRGLVPPEEFISFAEENGLIVPIGRWVLREAALQAATLERELAQDEPLYMCVNLSAKQLQQSDVVADVRDALEEARLRPALLTIEITETMLIEEPEIAVKKLRELRDLGVRIAMDDFGTGYSSLSYLGHFPIDVIKMDRSFLHQGQKPEGTDVSSAIVALGSSLSLDVVAEGIELEEQLERLSELGCTFGQGFVFARPMESKKLARFLGAEAVDGSLHTAGSAESGEPASTSDGG